jgi:hypothetical protein
MELRKECEGLRLGCDFNRLILIENDPKKFKLYKKLGLDVFKKKEKDATKKSNSKRKDSIDVNREDDNS